MAEKKPSKGQSGGVNINNSTVKVGGHVVGRDLAIDQGLDARQVAELARYFSQIKQQIERRPEDPNVDKQEIRSTVEKIEQEVRKGEKANPSKVERWLRFLAAMSDDIFQVTTATLTNPAIGIAKAIQLIAQKAKQEAGST